MLASDMDIVKPDYYSLDLVSQSRLGIVYSIINGLPIMKAKRETLEFGKQLHEAIFEPEVYARKLLAGFPFYAEFYEKIKGMKESAIKNLLLAYFLAHPKTKLEQDCFFTHTRTGVQCKLKADVWLFKTIGDLKTTACKTKYDFEETITKYGYHRQGAFYMDNTGSKQFDIIAISKTYPYPTFTYSLKLDDPRIIKGRAEVEILMDEYLRLKSEGVDFSSLMAAA